ncbi:hypothetical protein VNO78_06089 [Psophocarpus tetragonolobus]|uniref:Uncharacterized protein n=1 Tax=Psophocarpus tetragonolobus TaxID=3891 RepID=A0AAN9SUK4_PSOTE
MCPYTHKWQRGLYAYPAINVDMKGRLRSIFIATEPTDHRHSPLYVVGMAGFEQQMKDRAKELKVLFKKGVKIVGDSCKKGWNKVKNIKR